MTEKISVKEMDALVESMFKKREEIDAQKEVLGKLNEELQSIEAQALAALKTLERDNYRSPLGTVSIVEKWRVNLPQTEEDKRALFEHLNSRQIFFKYVTVNSNSLNSLFLADWEAAKQQGRGMEFKMPGVGDPKLYETLSLRKK